VDPSLLFDTVLPSLALDPFFSSLQTFTHFLTNKVLLLSMTEEVYSYLEQFKLFLLLYQFTLLKMKVAHQQSINL